MLFPGNIEGGFIVGIRQFFEDAFRIKVKPLDNAYDGMNITKDSEDLVNRQIHNTEPGSLIDVDAITKFRTLSSDRQQRYDEFENILKDATIAAAVEMYADDATQYNYRTGKIIWAESDDKDIEKAANRLLTVLKINENAWSWIYALVAFGDVYLRLYRNGDSSDYNELYSSYKSGTTVIRVKPIDKSRKIDEYVEYVDDPATMYDLQVRDKTSGFVRMLNVENNMDTTSSLYHSFMNNTVELSDVNIYDRTSFVHICLSGNIDRHPELLALTNSKDGSVQVYKVKTGKSILADAYEATKTVELLENSLMLNRVTKSALVRILQIEVGNMPKPEVEALLRRIKNMIEQKMALNKQNGVVASYNSPGPVENVVYIPTKEGKGVITSTNLGGDVNIKDIVDVDYFNNKKLSALKIPKQFLNYDAPEGLGNGTSLTKLSSRYAHTVMRIQNAFISGITNLLNLLFLDKGLEYINKFTLKMVSPATIEDTERDEQMNSRLDQASSIIDMIDGKINENGMLKVVEWILDNYLNLSDVSALLKKYKAVQDTDNSFEGPGGGSNSFDVDVNMGGGSGSFDQGPSMETTEFSSEPTEMEPTSEPTMTPEA